MNMHALSKPWACVSTTMAEILSTDLSTALAAPPQGVSCSDTGQRSEAMLPFWEPGSGHYGNTWGKLTQLITSSKTELVLSLLDTVPITQKDVFTMGDYGTNDGFASTPLFCSIIRRLQEKHGETLPIQIIYEDQEKNDFNSLFNRLSAADSPVSLFNNVFSLVTNVQFYKQCVPDASCHLIFSQTATHWMEKLDMKCTDSIFPLLATEAEKRRYREEAERDWIKFLVLRARELKPGGLLVITSISKRTNNVGKKDRDGDSAGDTKQYNTNDLEEELDKTDYAGIWIDLDAAWKEMRDEGQVTEEEYDRCVVKEAIRTAEEMTSPFEEMTSPVRQAGLTLVHFDAYLQPCIFKEAWKQKLDKEGIDDQKLFADNMVAGNQIWSYTTFRTSLSDQRSEEEKAAILDNLYRKFHGLVMSKDPASYRSELYMARLVARKC